MYDGHTVGVVIPAYNEERFVASVIESIPPYVDRAYVVDDGSTDDTWEKITEQAEKTNRRELWPALADGGHEFQKRIVPLRHATNSGRGAAVKTGFNRALQDRMDVIAVMDADGQMDPALLDRFIDPIVNNEADYTKGNRFLAPGLRREMSSWRLIGNVLLSYLTKIASGYWRTFDPQNGYTAISAQMLRSLNVDGLYEDYGFLNDMLVKLNVADARVVDIAMPARYGDETSGIRYTTFIPKVSGLLLWSFTWRLRVKYLLLDFHPLVGLYLLGGFGGLGGLIFLGWVLTTGVTSVQAALTLLVFLFSGTLLTLAMIFDRARNIGNEDRIEDHIEAGMQ